MPASLSLSPLRRCSEHAGVHHCFPGLLSEEKPRPGEAMVIFKLTEF